MQSPYAGALADPTISTIYGQPTWNPGMPPPPVLRLPNQSLLQLEHRSLKSKPYNPYRSLQRPWEQQPR